MRLDPNIASFLKTGLKKIEKDSEVYLFGSRVDDSQKGGDIDILWLTSEKIPQSTLRKFKVEFYKKFGVRKLDIVNFSFDQEDIFKEIALQKAVEL
jgi:predicted nucleotidyltransferase